MECGENGGQHESRRVIGQTDPQPPRVTERNELHTSDSLLYLLQDLPRLSEQVGARRCKPGKTMLFSRKQADAYLLFKPEDLFGERRLSDLQPLCGTTQIQLFGRDHKISEMAKLNISMPHTLG
jgi:hypothetical protein